MLAVELGRLGAGGVGVLALAVAGVVEELDVGDPVGRGVETLDDPEALFAAAHDVEAAVGEGLGLLDPHGAADLVRLLGLRAAAKQGDAEGLAGIVHVAHELAVARLEDVQRDLLAGEDDDLEGEDRQPRHLRTPAAYLETPAMRPARRMTRRAPPFSLKARKTCRRSAWSEPSAWIASTSW